MAMSNKPFQAFKGQDHQAHITTHLNFMATNIARNSPVVMGALEKNIFEHISLMALASVISLFYPSGLHKYKSGILIGRN